METITLHTAKFIFLGAKGKANIIEYRDMYKRLFDAYIEKLQPLNETEKENSIDLSIRTEEDYLCLIPIDKTLLRGLHEANIKKLNDLKVKPSPEQKDFSGLLKKLTPLYIKDCSTTDLQSIVIEKKLPTGRNRIKWIGNKADAIRFIEHYNITKKQFNKIFYFEDGKPLHAGHKDKTGTGSDLTDILKKY